MICFIMGSAANSLPFSAVASPPLSSTLSGKPQPVDATRGVQPDPEDQTVLRFDDNAEEAANVSVSICTNSEVPSVDRYGNAGPGAEGRVMSTTFRLDGQEFMALNGGPHSQFTEATSFLIDCQPREEVDNEVTISSST